MNSEKQLTTQVITIPAGGYFVKINNETFPLRTIKRSACLAKNHDIYNRWGELVFSSDNIQTGWDGTYKGEPAPQDIYLVRLMLKAKPGINFHTPFKFYEYTLTLMR